ncbi:MAG: sugar diacid recognition domain-containing protein [Lachnospiraceae bacterium]|nr:sugar diacid recognition domain-containing protein [Lachnospiraceae bacterium]
MFESIQRSTAQQIVDAVRDVCGYHINFITPDGLIAASTDPERVGTYHEVGHRVAQSGEIIEVAEEDCFNGTKQGVNMPFIYHGSTIAVIGITGKPEDVRKYAYLAQQITRIVLREHKLDARNHDKQAEIGHVVQALTRGAPINQDFLDKFLAKHGLSEETEYRTVVIHLNSGYNPMNLYMIEREILETFELTGSDFHHFNFPTDYIQIIQESAYRKHTFAYRNLAERNGQILQIGIGSSAPLRQQSVSYQNALIAEKAASPVYVTPGVACYDDLDLEILLGSIPEQVSKKYIKKIVFSLNEKEKEILNTYFATSCSLKETAARLFIHKNTLQYQLDKVARDTGYDPRRFSDAVVLFAALKLQG